MADKHTGRSGEHVQGVPPSQHDIPHDSGGPTTVPDAGHLEQGTKPPETRDPADKADHPKPR